MRCRASSGFRCRLVFRCGCSELVPNGRRRLSPGGTALKKAGAAAPLTHCCAHTRAAESAPGGWADRNSYELRGVAPTVRNPRARSSPGLKVCYVVCVGAAVAHWHHVEAVLALKRYRLANRGMHRSGQQEGSERPRNRYRPAVC